MTQLPIAQNVISGITYIGRWHTSCLPRMCLMQWNPAEQAEVEEGLVAIDANGNKLADGDTVTFD